MDRRQAERVPDFRLGDGQGKSTAIHQAGASKFYLTGYNVRFLEMNLLRQYLHEMVKMSSLQSYSVEIVPEDQGTRVLGAAVAAEQAAGRC